MVLSCLQRSCKQVSVALFFRRLQCLVKRSVLPCFYRPALCRVCAFIIRTSCLVINKYKLKYVFVSHHGPYCKGNRITQSTKMVTRYTVNTERGVEHWKSAPSTTTFTYFHTGPSGVTDREARGRAAPPGKLNIKTGPPLVDILTFSIL